MTKKRRVLRVFAVVIIVALLGGLFSACGAKARLGIVENSTFKIEKEGVSFTFPATYTPVTKQTYDSNKVELAEKMQAHGLDVDTVVSSFENIDLTLYAFDESAFPTRILFFGNGSASFKTLDMKEQKTIDLLLDSAQEALGAEKAFTNSYTVAYGEQVFAVYEYKEVYAKTGTQVKSINYITLHGDKLYTFAMMADELKYEGAVKEVEGILRSLQMND